MSKQDDPYFTFAAKLKTEERECEDGQDFIDFLQNNNLAEAKGGVVKAGIDHFRKHSEKRYLNQSIGQLEARRNRLGEVEKSSFDELVQGLKQNPLGKGGERFSAYQTLLNLYELLDREWAFIDSPFLSHRKKADNPLRRQEAAKLISHFAKKIAKLNLTRKEILAISPFIKRIHEKINDVGKEGVDRFLLALAARKIDGQELHGAPSSGSSPFMVILDIYRYAYDDINCAEENPFPLLATFSLGLSSSESSLLINLFREVDQVTRHDGTSWKKILFFTLSSSEEGVTIHERVANALLLLRLSEGGGIDQLLHPFSLQTLQNYCQIFIQRQLQGDIKDIKVLLQKMSNWREPEAIFFYLNRAHRSGFTPEVEIAKQDSIRFLQRVARGTFHQERYALNDSPHRALIFSHHPSLAEVDGVHSWLFNEEIGCEELDPNLDQNKEWRDYRLLFTDDPEEFVLMGGDTPSCQYYGENFTTSHTLLSHALDGEHKLLLLKSKQGKQNVARAVFRLMWNSSRKAPLLFLEKIYHGKGSPPFAERMVERMALRQAERMNLLLLTTGDDEGIMAQALKSSCSRRYIDALSHERGGVGEVCGIRAGDRPYYIRKTKTLYDPAGSFYDLPWLSFQKIVTSLFWK